MKWILFVFLQENMCTIRYQNVKQIKKDKLEPKVNEYISLEASCLPSKKSNTENITNVSNIESSLENNEKSIIEETIEKTLNALFLKMLVLQNEWESNELYWFRLMVDWHEFKVNYIDTEIVNTTIMKDAFTSSFPNMERELKLEYFNGLFNSFEAMERSYPLELIIEKRWNDVLVEWNRKIRVFHCITQVWFDISKCEYDKEDWYSLEQHHKYMKKLKKTLFMDWNVLNRKFKEMLKGFDENDKKKEKKQKNGINKGEVIQINNNIIKTKTIDFSNIMNKINLFSTALLEAEAKKWEISKDIDKKMYILDNLEAIKKNSENDFEQKRKVLRINFKSMESIFKDFESLHSYYINNNIVRKDFDHFYLLCKNYMENLKFGSSPPTLLISGNFETTNVCNASQILKNIICIKNLADELESEIYSLRIKILNLRKVVLRKIRLDKIDILSLESITCAEWEEIWSTLYEVDN